MPPATDACASQAVRINLASLGLSLLLATFVVLLMSFEDPFRVALFGLLLAVQGPVWRAIHALDPQPARIKISPQHTD